MHPEKGFLNLRAANHEPLLTKVVRYKAFGAKMKRFKFAIGGANIQKTALLGAFLLLSLFCANRLVINYQMSGI